MSDRIEPRIPVDREGELSGLGLRKSSGAYYTPPGVVDLLLRVSLDPLLEERVQLGIDAVSAVRILDPSCGTGHFLVAAFDRVRAALVACGLSTAVAAERAARSVIGVDSDRGAVEICRRVLAERSGVPTTTSLGRSIRCADSLLLRLSPQPQLFVPGEDDKEYLSDWATFRAEIGAEVGFDLVIGNPPFLGQLRRETAHPPDYLRRLKERFGRCGGGAYVDSAALFLLVGLDVVRPDRGRICLIEPLSVLSTKGTEPVRGEVAARAAITHLWLPSE